MIEEKPLTLEDIEKMMEIVRNAPPPPPEIRITPMAPYSEDGNGFKFNNTVYVHPDTLEKIL